MAISPDDLKNDGFGTIVQELNAGGGDSTVQIVSLLTSNAVPNLLFQYTLNPSTSATFRATIAVTRVSSAAVVGKFVREFTVKRVGSGPAVLLQDLVPSLDYQEDPGLAVASGVDTNNATITVTGMPAALAWHGRVEIIA